jgi:hypothetical protein
VARDGGRLGLCDVRRRHVINAVAVREQDRTEGHGLGLYSPGFAPRMEGWRLEGILGGVEYERRRPDGVRRKMVETSLTCGPGA